MNKTILIKSGAAAAAIGCIIAAVCLINANGNKESDENLEMKDVSVAISEAKDSSGKKYQNLVLPENISIPQVDEIYRITATSKGSTDINEGLKKLCMAMEGKEPPEFKKKDDGVVAAGNINYQAEFYTANSFLYAKHPEDPENPWAEYDTDQAAAVYDLEKDDISGISYDFSGNQYSLTDAVRLAENTVSEKLSDLLKWDSETKAKEIVVFESKERGHYYYVTFEHYFDGMPILRSGTGDPLETRVFPSRLDIHIHDPNVVTVVDNYAYTEKTDKVPVKKIITLEEALKKAEKELAPEKVYEIKDVRLEYVAVDTTIGGGIIKEYRPTWCLVTQYQTRDPIMPDPKEILLIDAITGDISLWSDKEMGYVFGAPKPTAIRDDEMFTSDEIAEDIKRQYGLSDKEFKELIGK